MYYSNELPKNFLENNFYLICNYHPCNLSKFFPLSFFVVFAIKNL